MGCCSPFKGRDALSKIAGGDLVAKAGSELVRDLGLREAVRGLPRFGFAGEESGCRFSFLVVCCLRECEQK